MALATDTVRTYLLFFYDEINWATDMTTIGFSIGDDTNFFKLPESLTREGILNLDTMSNVGKPGVFVFRVDMNG